MTNCESEGEGVIRELSAAGLRVGRIPGVLLGAVFLAALGLQAQTLSAAQKSARPQAARADHWRPATEKELATIIPERAPVISERIETELRTASAVVDGKGHAIAGAVLITAGYSANGKYSIFLMTQVPLRIGEKVFAPGRYLLGWTRGEDSLAVTISDAMSGDALLSVPAKRNTTIHRVEPIHIWPPQDHSVIQLGRFTIPYSIQ